MNDTLVIDGHPATGREGVARAAAERLGWPCDAAAPGVAPCVVQTRGKMPGDARWIFCLERAGAPTATADLNPLPPRAILIDVTGMDPAEVGAMIAALVQADLAEARDKDRT